MNLDEPALERLIAAAQELADAREQPIGIMLEWVLSGNEPIRLILWPHEQAPLSVEAARSRLEALAGAVPGVAESA